MYKIKFAYLISQISHWGMRCLDMNELRQLEAIVTPNTATQLAERPIVSEESVENLMRLMAGKQLKIEAIKAYRTLTNAGLKEAKDAVERYW